MFRSYSVLIYVRVSKSTNQIERLDCSVQISDKLEILYLIVKKMITIFKPIYFVEHYNVAVHAIKC